MIIFQAVIGNVINDPFINIICMYSSSFQFSFSLAHVSHYNHDKKSYILPLDVTYNLKHPFHEWYTFVLGMVRETIYAKGNRNKRFWDGSNIRYCKVSIIRRNFFVVPCGIVAIPTTKKFYSCLYNWKK